MGPSGLGAGLCGVLACRGVLVAPQPAMGGADDVSRRSWASQLMGGRGRRNAAPG